ncbi:MAG: CoA activase, partial [Firmicutes bacterium]|nr:CoA activase [Bacillota bacterium]
MRYEGLCLGASTISLVTLEEDEKGLRVVAAQTHPHEGKPRQVLWEMLKGKEQARLCATGRKFRHLLSLPQIPEPEAVEMANAFCCQEKAVDAIVSAGGETFLLYELDKKGLIANVYTGSKCASGTGEFFLQQIKRMGLEIEEALSSAGGAEPYPVSGRCSVFCKSDCTHALNKGENKGRVVAGLCRMMARKILELVQKAGARRILLVGGTASNRLMVNFLVQEYGLEVIVPPEAPYFEALGAALWAYQHKVEPLEITKEKLFASHYSSFTFHPPLRLALKRVAFKELARQQASPGDRLLLGLDVGSTTTKAVLIKEKEHSLVASVYLRTQGDPVAAARQCYASLAKQVHRGIEVIAIGVTGSGRQIAGLHALTPGVINEKMAHAAAAVYFDPQVDTIFEIGGQDAKYTYIINGVPADYAMNEACSAGTGSFLEEAAKESMEVEMTDIAPLAMEAESPPNFNDQCAAFIGSDIKTAVQEGFNTSDILGGLVYSICLNYLTRVKGNRPVGQKIFMQGGVCYNKAVPVAMAALLDKEIVVPPEPGLMGAFGVALEVEKKIKQGLLAEGKYDLEDLAAREITYLKPFTCRGDASCDRRCTVNVLEIKGKKYPFGGACSRYTGIKSNKSSAAEKLDLVSKREHLIFNKVKVNNDEEKSKAQRLRVAVTRSLLVNSLFPLYQQFFQALDVEVVIPDRAEPAGMLRQGAPFCYPVELSHGFMLNLLQKKPDYLFLPQVKGMPKTVEKEKVSIICPLAQGEPYYLRAAFPELRENNNVISPLLDFSRGFASQESKFVRLGKKLGATAAKARHAYRLAVNHHQALLKKIKEWGDELLEELEKNPQMKAIVIFGRYYNALTGTANMGIPRKFASRGWLTVPFDCLPFEGEKALKNMYWSNGQIILQAARLVKKHPQLFGAYITNFSCGPDSFLISYFRDIMGEKPSLTLELDSHTSDAGLDTRIEAFLDIIKGATEACPERVPLRPRFASARENRRPQTIQEKGQLLLKLPSGEKLTLKDPRLKILIPSMGNQSNRFLAAVCRQQGLKAIALPPPGHRELKLGQAHTTCKECLPLQLTAGSLLRYLEENNCSPREQLLYFMPDASGPCRFGQYQVLINHLLHRLGIGNVTTLSLSANNSYAGLGTAFTFKAWQALIVADVISEIYSSLLVLCQDKEEALQVYAEGCDLLVEALAQGSWAGLRQTMSRVA